MRMLRTSVCAETRRRLVGRFRAKHFPKKRWDLVVGLIAACGLFGYSNAIFGAQVDCVSPKLTLPSECGIVTDMHGVPITGATVSVGLGDVGSFVKTDEHGRWGFLSDEKNFGWLTVEATGFETARFKYSTKGKSTNACRRPVYIRLIVGLDGCPVATLHENEGIKK